MLQAVMTAPGQILFRQVPNHLPQTTRSWLPCGTSGSAAQISTFTMACTPIPLIRSCRVTKFPA